MQDSIAETSFIRLGVTPGVPSHQLSALMALQRREEPEVVIALAEVSNDALMAGLREGRYDVGLALAGAADASLHSQPMWREEMAIAMPLRYPLLEKTALTLDDVVDCPIFRWQAESCPLLDQQIASLPEKPCDIQHVASLESMALWVAAGYGIGITAQSRLVSARAWGICIRPFADTPFEIITSLVRPTKRHHDRHERFERRASQVAGLS